MKPYHVFIAVMVLMTVVALYKYADNQRIEVAYKERSIASLNVKPPTDREICLAQVKDERICK